MRVTLLNPSQKPYSAFRSLVLAVLCPILLGVIPAHAAPAVRPALQSGWTMQVRIESSAHDVCIGGKMQIGISTNIIWVRENDRDYRPPFKGSGIAGTHVDVTAGAVIPPSWSYNLKLGPNFQEVTYTAPDKPGDVTVRAWAEYYNGEYLYHREATPITFRVIHCKYKLSFEGKRAATGTMAQGQASVSTLQKVTGEGTVSINPETLSVAGYALLSGQGTIKFTQEVAAITAPGGTAQRTSQPQGESTFHAWGNTAPGGRIKLAIRLDPVQVGEGTGQACVGGKCISGTINTFVTSFSNPALQDLEFPEAGASIVSIAPLTQILGLTIESNYDIDLQPADQ